MTLRLFALLGVCACCTAMVGTARAGSEIFVGIADDYLKSEPARAAAPIRDLGVSAVRLTLRWDGTPSISEAEATALDRALGAEVGVRIVLSVYDRERTPQSDADRNAYCAYLANIAERFAQIRDFVIWNEPNKSTFWRPQFAGERSAAPRAYAELLARCYDVLHEVVPGVNVIHGGLSSTGNDRPEATSNVSHSPGAFIREEGAAYRAMGRQEPLFDTFGMHPYGERSSERPWRLHAASSTIGLGDWPTLMQALWDGFQGTPQPIPGEGTPIWYLEIGWQTMPDTSKRGLYTGSETEASPVPDDVGANDDGDGEAPDQATQYFDAIRLAYCQPYVEAIFPFLLVDERSLGRWQSGALWADWTRKDSFEAFRAAIAEAHSDRVDCSTLKGGPVPSFHPKTGVEVLALHWPKARQFNWKHDLWRFRIQVDEPAAYTAMLTAAGSSRPVVSVNGELRRRYLVFVMFPRQRLRPGLYTMSITLTSKENAERITTLSSPAFRVRVRR
jgi:hypothetical protein